MDATWRGRAPGGTTLFQIALRNVGSTPRLFDPRPFTVLDLEVAGLTAGLPGDSCGEQPACVITTTTSATPEPTTTMLLATGLALMLGGRGWRRRPSAAALARMA